MDGNLCVRDGKCEPVLLTIGVENLPRFFRKVGHQALIIHLVGIHIKVEDKTASVQNFDIPVHIQPILVVQTGLYLFVMPG